MPAVQTLLGPALLLVAAILALVVDAATSQRRSVVVTAAALALAVPAFAWAAVAPPTAFAGDAFLLGAGPAALGALCALLGSLALFASSRRLALRANGGQVAALVAFSTFGSALLISSANIAAFVIALEVVALSGYALVGAAGSARASEAAVKYAVQGAVATGVLAYGLAIVVGGFGGVLRYDTVSAGGAVRPLVTALVLVLAALSFKLGAFPFHSWAPDAYETADPGIAGFLAAVPKLAALVATGVLLFRVFAAMSSVWPVLVAVLGAASIVFGNLVALRQRSFRRMLGYSGIAQVGYAFAALTGPFADPVPLILFGASYAVAASGAFFAAEAAAEGAGWDGSVAGLAGLSRRKPVVAGALAVCLLSLTGIPLTVGFWGKFAAFGVAANVGYVWLAILGVAGSVVSFGYYGGVLRAVFLDEPGGEPTEPTEELVPSGDMVTAPDEDGEGSLVPRSVGALAADDPSVPPAGVSPAAVATVAAAAIVLAAGLAPLVFGLNIFAPLARW